MNFNQTLNYTLAELLINMSSPPTSSTRRPRTKLNHPEPYMNCYYQAVSQLNYSICSASIKQLNNNVALSHFQFQGQQAYWKETQQGAEEIQSQLDNTSHQILSLQAILVLFVDLYCQKKCHANVQDFEKQAEYLQVKAQLESIMQAMGIPTECLDCEKDNFLNQLFLALHHSIVQDETTLLHVELLHRRTDLDVRLRSLAIAFRTPIEKFAQKLIEKNVPGSEICAEYARQAEKNLLQPFNPSHFPVGEEV